MPRAAGAKQFAQRRRPAAIRGSANAFKAHVMRDPGQILGVAVPAQEHRQIAMPAKKERTENIFMPEDVDLLPAAVRNGRVDAWIVAGPLVFDPAHPTAN